MNAKVVSWKNNKIGVMVKPKNVNDLVCDNIIYQKHNNNKTKIGDNITVYPSIHNKCRINFYSDKHKNIFAFIFIIFSCIILFFGYINLRFTIQNDTFSIFRGLEYFFRKFI